MAILSLIRKIIFFGLISLVVFFLYPFFSEHKPLVLTYKSGLIYTTQDTLALVCFFGSILIFGLLKLTNNLLSRGFFIADLINFIKRNKRQATLQKKIEGLIHERKYRKALRLSKKHLHENKEILYLHLHCLVETNKQFRFLKIFHQNPIGKGIELFIQLSQRWSSFRRFCIIFFFTRKKHQENEVFAYIYAHNLYERKKPQQALKVLEKFLNRKFFNDAHTFYLFNKLALKIEKEISGNEDFAGQYIENIEHYEKFYEEKIKRS